MPFITKGCFVCSNLQEIVLELKATLPIRKGEEIFNRYTPPELISLKRQSLLQSQWYFSCDCRRCLDPTECKTMASAIKCCFKHEEEDGTANEHYLLPQNPRDIISEWACNIDPTHIVKAKYAKEVIAEAENSIRVASKVSRKCLSYNSF